MSRPKLLFAFVVSFLVPHTVSAAEPPWTEIHVKHFSLITDAGEKRGREIALRLEQMRTVFGGLLMKGRLNSPVPLTVMATRNSQQYSEMAPSKSNGPGFLVPGEDHAFIILNASVDAPWRAIAADFARLLLNDNYPPTQPWFDEGLVEYFSSIWINDRQVELGGDPQANSPHPFTEILKTSPWLPITELFSTRAESAANGGPPRELFSAESWIVMHYLLNQQKLPAAGTYFDLVLNQKLPVEQAVPKAFGMSPAQLEQAVKDYFHSQTSAGQSSSLTKSSAAQATASQTASQTALVPARPSPLPLSPDDVAMTISPFAEADARAVIAEIMARIPEDHEQGLKQLQQLAAEPTNNEIAHRALAWQKIEQNEFQPALQELSTALELNRRDIWIRYYLSALKYQMAQHTGQSIEGLANMMQDLRAVLDWYPEFAEAYNMLGMARVEGGGMNSALEAIRAAIQLSPRKEQYVFNLGLVYVAWKKWEPAHAIFERLKDSSNPRLAAAADSQLQEMATRQKYGIPPQKPAAPPGADIKPGTAVQAAVSNSKSRPPRQSSSTPEEATTTAPDKSAETRTESAPAPGPIQFLKGKLMAVDCSHPPAAILSILANGRTLHLRTPDYKSLTLVGADTFSCAWENRQISINYRPAGKTGGDLVSLELR